MKKKKKPFDLTVFIISVLLVILCITTLYPVLYVVSASFSDPDMFVASKGQFMIFPKGFSLESYKMVLGMDSVWTGYRNTVFYVTLGTSMNMFMTAIGAYVLSRPGLVLNRILALMIVFTMQFGGGMIPTYILVTNLLGNSIWTLLIPGLITTTNLIIMRTGFSSIPASLVEAAEIDGAGHICIFTQIILPLSKATMAVISLYYAVAHWNSWFAASIYLRDRDLYPLQLFLKEILIANQLDEALMGADAGMSTSIQETIKYAVIMVAIIPVLIAYPFVQKQFVKGVMIGGVKG